MTSNLMQIWPNYLLQNRPQLLEDEELVVVSIKDQVAARVKVCSEKKEMQNQLFRLEILESIQVSTALKGAGNLNGSGQTPLGWHQIRAKIGENCPQNSVFIGRRPTGEIFSDELAKLQPARDWILTRIFWLSGLQKGFNRFGNCDSMRRYIYFHGTPDFEPMGIAKSHGCIRLRNLVMMRWFDQLQAHTKVLISEVSHEEILSELIKALNEKQN